MSQNVPTDRVRIFNRAGYPVAEFSANVSRSWAIAKEGRASFSYPTIKANVVNKEVLQFGNYLLVENSILPEWVGVIDAPREWEEATIKVNAYTPERLFAWRRGADGERVVKGSAGTIFSEMVKVINAAEKTILVAGDIWMGGEQREETFTPETLDRNLRQLQSRSLEEYVFRGTAGIGGRLIIRADWTKQLGVKSNLSLWQGFGGGNIESPRAREDGKIINNIFGYGDGLTWASKPQKITSNPTSAGTYGLREGSKDYRGVTTITTVINNNVSTLRKSIRPSWVLGLNALNVGNTFSYLQLGNYFQISLENIGFGDDRIGFSSQARIMGMSYNPDTPNKIKLVLQEQEI